MSGSQVTPGACRCLPDLRLDIDADSGINPAADHKNVAIGQGSVRRIPAAIVHIRQPRPNTVRRVISIRIAQTDPVKYVSAGHEKPSISQKRMTGTENVCSQVGQCPVRACRGIPFGRIIPVIERRPPQHLAGRKNMSMHGQVWPRYRGRPLSDRRRCLRLRCLEEAWQDKQEQRNEGSN